MSDLQRSRYTINLRSVCTQSEPEMATCPKAKGWRHWALRPLDPIIPFKIKCAVRVQGNIVFTWMVISKSLIMLLAQLNLIQILPSCLIKGGDNLEGIRLIKLINPFQAINRYILSPWCVGERIIWASRGNLTTNNNLCISGQWESTLIYKYGAPVTGFQFRNPGV